MISRLKSHTCPLHGTGPGFVGIPVPFHRQGFHNDSLRATLRLDMFSFLPKSSCSVSMQHNEAVFMHTRYAWKERRQVLGNIGHLQNRCIRHTQPEVSSSFPFSSSFPKAGSLYAYLLFYKPHNKAYLYTCNLKENS